MDAAGFDYTLPDAAIAQRPAEPRDSSRLLVDGDPVSHLLTGDFPTLIRPGDVVVLNDTRVLPARLHLTKATGGKVEVLALEPAEPGAVARHRVDQAGDWWEALVRPSRRVPDGTLLQRSGDRAVLQVGPATGEGTRLVAPVGCTWDELLGAHGEVPLPPYITTPLTEPDRYQTVYAENPSSVAAPTAGLHLTAEAIERCVAAGAEVHTVELAVGVGTFRPLEADVVEDHVMHSERYVIEEDTWDACRRADRVVAVGTTVVRTLEAAAATGSLSGRTDLFIRPGHRFQVVDALLTNFHMPRSTLLVMLEAFIGPRWRDLYRIALDEGYRFLSFGDAMFIERDRSQTLDGGA